MIPGISSVDVKNPHPVAPRMGMDSDDENGHSREQPFPQL
jgi:hypothetical protein